MKFPRPEKPRKLSSWVDVPLTEEIGRGGETTVHELMRGRDEKMYDLVLKPFEIEVEGSDYPWKHTMEHQRGFEEPVKERLEEMYRAMQREYGPYIPRAFVVESKKDKGLYYLLQKRIDIDEPGDVSLYEQEDFAPDASLSQEENARREYIREQFRDLSKRFKRNTLGYLNHDGKSILLDAWDGVNNLVLDTSGKVWYIDSTARLPDSDADLHLELPDASFFVKLDLLSGNTIEELKDDPFYQQMDRTWRRLDKSNFDDVLFDLKNGKSGNKELPSFY